MEYKNGTESGTITKISKFRKLLKLIEKDNYFTLTIIISVIFLFIDYLIVCRFIELLNLL